MNKVLYSQLAVDQQGSFSEKPCDFQREWSLAGNPEHSTTEAFGLLR